MTRDPSNVEIVDLDGAVPLPSEALRARVTGDGAVVMRRPMLQWALQLGGWLAVAAVAVFVIGARHDHGALVGSAIAWVLLLGGALLGLLVPESGQVLTSGVRLRAALITLPLAGLALALGALDGTGTHLHAPKDELHALMHCLGFGLALALPLAAITWLAVRRLVLVDSALAGAALGAAAGALGAFVLHLVCPIGGALHAGAGHAGCIAVGALAGALLGRTR